MRVAWNRRPNDEPSYRLEFRSTGPAGTGKASRDPKPLFIRVGYGSGGTPAGIYTKRKVPGLPFAQRRALGQAFRRKELDRRDWLSRKVVWIDTGWKDCKAVARFLVLLYLWQADKIADSDLETPDVWRALTTVLARCGVRDDGFAGDVLRRLREKFAFPDHPRGILTYVRRVAADMKRSSSVAEASMELNCAEELMAKRARGGKNLLGHAGPIDLLRGTDRWLSPAQLAEQLGVSRETIYRWAKQGKLQGTNLPGTPLRFSEAYAGTLQPAIPRTSRRYLLEKLQQMGWAPAAARKHVWRRRKQGFSLGEIAREAMGSCGSP